MPIIKTYQYMEIYVWLISYTESKKFSFILRVQEKDEHVILSCFIINMKETYLISRFPDSMIIEFDSTVSISTYIYK